MSKKTSDINVSAFQNNFKADIARRMKAFQDDLKPKFDMEAIRKAINPPPSQKNWLAIERSIVEAGKADVAKINKQIAQEVAAAAKSLGVPLEVAMAVDAPDTQAGKEGKRTDAVVAVAKAGIQSVLSKKHGMTKAEIKAAILATGGDVSYLDKDCKELRDIEKKIKSDAAGGPRNTKWFLA